MKVVFVGGGAHRYLCVARSILAESAVLNSGEINVYDLNQERASAMGRMIQKTPEFSRNPCKVSWGTTLEQALDGADVVIVVLMAGNLKNFELSKLACRKYGFIGSDQLSPSGAFLALKGGPIVLDIAKKMEKYCPKALLLDFANPVAVISAAVNNHTKIRCLGVCAGYTNHLWDLSRIFGKDQEAENCEIQCAGVNHMSFIMRGSKWEGKDLYEQLDKMIPTWQMCRLSDRWNEGSKKNITNSVSTLVRYYRKYGVMVFSSEGDGLEHLDMQCFLTPEKIDLAAAGRELDTKLAESRARRMEGDKYFASFIDKNMTEADWNKEDPEALYLLREDENIMSKAIRALSGVEEMKIATCFPNNGAVEGYTDRTILEYSQILDKNGIRPAGKFAVPVPFYGLVAGLSSHQTLLGDAIATADPKVLFQALYSYPVRQDSGESKEMWKTLLEINKEELPASFQEAAKYICM